MRTDILNNWVEKLIDLAITESKIMPIHANEVFESERKYKNDRDDDRNPKIIRDSYTRSLKPKFYSPSLIVRKESSQAHRRNLKSSKSNKVNQNFHNGTLFCSYNDNTGPHEKKSGL